MGARPKLVKPNRYLRAEQRSDVQACKLYKYFAVVKCSKEMMDMLGAKKDHRGGEDTTRHDTYTSPGNAAPLRAPYDSFAIIPSHVPVRRIPTKYHHFVFSAALSSAHSTDALSPEVSVSR